MCLDECGIDAETQDAIMDPAFSYLREGGGSCLFWVRDTVEMRFVGLEEVGRTSRGRGEKLRREIATSIGSGGDSKKGEDGNGRVEGEI